AASTGAVLSQRTPSRVTPMPRADSQLGSAATIGADGFTTSIGAAQPRRGLILGLAVIGAIAVGALVYLVLNSSTKDEQVAAAPPAPIEELTPAPVPEPTPTPTPTIEPPAPDPEYVKVTIEGAPAGTEVYLAGNLLGVVPEVQLPRGDDTLLLTFQLDGYKPATKQIRPVQDKTLEVALKKKKGRTVTPKGSDGREGRDGRNTLEDPFQ
ncbi:MAG TPA: PEGA domain-containing protein, partial [Kofleriaceae bacterium]|nr:PEGA domain-containing protein [Kofleriaceae bacterium]